MNLSGIGWEGVD